MYTFKNIINIYNNYDFIQFSIKFKFKNKTIAKSYHDIVCNLRYLHEFFCLSKHKKLHCFQLRKLT